MNEKDQEIVGVVIDIVANKKARFLMELLAVIATVAMWILALC